MRLVVRGVVVLTIAAAGLPAPRAAAAQSAPAVDVTALLTRMTRLLEGGDARAARTAADSALVALPEADVRRAEALFVRATTAAAPAAARTDWLRIVVDHPLSPRVEDALVALADLEWKAGDRAATARHLQRLIGTGLTTESGVRGAYRVALPLLQGGDARLACDALDSARVHVPAGQVELANQIGYSARPCESLSIPVGLPRDTATTSAADTTKPSRKAAVSTGRAWSAQIAAFASRGDALRLAARLSGRGYEARVTTDKPYRVRIGRFAARADAVALAEKLKAQGTTAIVVEAER
jgi:cell division septation protein DedD